MTVDRACTQMVPVAIGHVPGTLEACTALMRVAALAANVPGAVRCIAIARARQLYTDARAGEWIQWVFEEWPELTNKSEVHHKRAIGDMLIREHEGVWYTTLIQLSQDKLLAMTRLPADKLTPFMEAADPRNQTREQVRARVGKWLGEAAGGVQKTRTGSAGALQKKGQLDFFTVLDASLHLDDAAIDKAADDDRYTPTQAFSAGLHVMLAGVKKAQRNRGSLPAKERNMIISALREVMADMLEL